MSQPTYLHLRISHYLSLLWPIAVGCPCICTTTIPYRRFLFFRSSVRIRKKRGSLRVFAGGTNALLFTPNNQLIDARILLLRLCKFTLFFIHCESSSPASSSTKSQSSLFLFFLPHIFSLFNLHTAPLSIHLTACPALLPYLIITVSRR